MRDRDSSTAPCDPYIGGRRGRGRKRPAQRVLAAALASLVLWGTCLTSARGQSDPQSQLTSRSTGTPAAQTQLVGNSTFSAADLQSLITLRATMEDTRRQLLSGKSEFDPGQMQRILSDLSPSDETRLTDRSEFSPEERGRIDADLTPPDGWFADLTSTLSDRLLQSGQMTPEEAQSRMRLSYTVEFATKLVDASKPSPAFLNEIQKRSDPSNEERKVLRERSLGIDPSPPASQ